MIRVVACLSAVSAASALAPLDPRFAHEHVRPHERGFPAGAAPPVRAYVGRNVHRGRNQVRGGKAAGLARGRRLRHRATRPRRRRALVLRGVLLVEVNNNSRLPSQ